MLKELEPGLPDLDRIEKLININKEEKKNPIKVLVLSEGDYTRFTNSLFYRVLEAEIKKLKELGIERICWSSELKDNQIRLSTGASIPTNNESLWLRKLGKRYEK